MSKEHKAPFRRNDEMSCGSCMKTWDINDPEPPECDPVRFRGGPTHPQNLPRAEDMADWDDKFRGHRQVVAQLQSKGALRNTDFASLEERVVGHATAGWPTPNSPLSAWLVSDVEDPKTALLMYAMTGKNACQFVSNVLKIHGTLEASRCQAMDGEARGMSPYCDANPNNRKKAGKVSRRSVVSITEWQKP